MNISLILQMAADAAGKAIDEVQRQRLAAGDHPAQRRAAAGARLLDKDLQKRRHEVQRRDLTLPDEFGQVRRVAMPVGMHDVRIVGKGVGLADSRFSLRQLGLG